MSEENDLIKDKNLLRCLNEVARQEGFHDYVLKCVDNDLQIVGLFSNIVTVNIIDKYPAESEKTLHIIAKVAPNDDNLRAQISASIIFNNEIYFYDTIFPFFVLFEKQRGLVPCDFAPKFYKVEKKDKMETILLENLCTKGFMLHNPKIPMNKCHLNMVLSNYGRFHALSFALKEQNPGCFDNFVHKISDNFFKFVENGKFDYSVKLNCENALQLLTHELGNVELSAFTRTIQEIPKIVYELVPSVDNYSVIIHGDCRINNMMFKYQKNSNASKPTNIKLLDFQFSRFGSPVQDLSYFFYTCCPEEALDELEYYLKVYYDSFCYYMQKLGSSPEKLFPYSALQDHWKKFARWGLIMAPTIITYMLSEAFETVDLNKAQELGKVPNEALAYKVSNAELFKTRIQKIITHFVENEFLTAL